MASIFRVQDRGSRLHNGIIQRPKFFMTIVEVLSICTDMINEHMGKLGIMVVHENDVRK
jgi:hypothetical protein